MEFNGSLTLENVSFTNVPTTSEITFSGVGRVSVEGMRQTGETLDVGFSLGDGSPMRFFFFFFFKEEEGLALPSLFFLHF